MSDQQDDPTEVTIPGADIDPSADVKEDPRVEGAEEAYDPHPVEPVDLPTRGDNQRTLILYPTEVIQVDYVEEIEVRTNLNEVEQIVIDGEMTERHLTAWVPATPSNTTPNAKGERLPTRVGKITATGLVHRSGAVTTVALDFKNSKEFTEWAMETFTQ